MPTEASRRALEGMRDVTTLQWYVIPLLAMVFYIYIKEIIVANLVAMGLLGWVY